jgi:pimeloyl-ACP methyl ester carboxylesterase
MWDHVIGALPPGTEVLVADLPTCRRPGTDLLDDVAHVRELVGDRQAVLVGHSYGGTVITEAGASIPGTEHLVYLAAAMPDVGETMFDWVMKRPFEDATPLVFHDDGTCDLEIDWDDRRYDDATTERIRATRLRPFAIAGITTPITTAAWSTLPSTYVVATRDTTIHPDTQREMAQRAGQVLEVDAEHLVNLEHPAAVADLVAAVSST